MSVVENGYNFQEWFDKAKSKYGEPLPLQTYHGTGKPHYCDRNSWRHRKELLVFKGELIPVRRPFYDGSILAHIFNVDPQTGGVIEYSPISNGTAWFNDFFYFGRLAKVKTMESLWD